MIFLFFVMIIVKSRMHFLAVTIIVCGFDLAGDHAEVSDIQVFIKNCQLH